MPEKTYAKLPKDIYFLKVMRGGAGDIPGGYCYGYDNTTDKMPRGEYGPFKTLAQALKDARAREGWFR